MRARASAAAPTSRRPRRRRARVGERPTRGRGERRAGRRSITARRSASAARATALARARRPFFQLRLEEPIVPARRRSPRDPHPRAAGHARRRRRARPAPTRHGPSRDLLARLARLERGEPEPEAPPGPPRRAPKRASARRSTPRALALEQRLSQRRPRAAARRRPRAARRSCESTAARSGSGRDARPPRRARRGPRPRRRARSSATARSRSPELRDELGTHASTRRPTLEPPLRRAKVTLRRGEARVRAA